MQNNSITTVQTDQSKIQAIPLWQSLLVFGVPGILVWAGTYYGVPIAVNQGIALGLAWTIALFTPLAITSCGLVIYHFVQDGNNWQTFKNRFRFTTIPRSDWKWMALAIPTILILNSSLAWTQPFLREGLPLQPIIPELFVDPYATVSSDGTGGTFMGWSMSGQVWLLTFWFIWVMVAVLMEEVIWRGYLLPRMEVTHGRWAWLINGILWNVPFHLYTLWNVATDFPMMLIIPFLAQRTKSTWTSMILHLVFPYLGFAYLIPGVFNQSI